MRWCTLSCAEPVSDTTSSDSYRGNSQQPQLDDRRPSLSAPADSSVDDSATSHTNTSLDQPVNPRQSPDQADTGTFGDTNVRVDDKNSDNTDEEGGLGNVSLCPWRVELPSGGHLYDRTCGHEQAQYFLSDFGPFSAV